MELDKKDFIKLMEQINDLFLPCPFCGKRPFVFALFDNNKTLEPAYLQLLHENEDCPAANWFDEFHEKSRVDFKDVEKLVEWWNKRN